MNRDKFARTAGRAGWLALSLCVVGSVLAQEPMPGPAQPLRGDGDLPNPLVHHSGAPLPLPIASGTPWMQNSLLAPLHQRFMPQAAQQREPVSQEVREIEGVIRSSSALRGTIFDGDREQDEAARREIFAKLERERLAQESTNTQRVSDDGELPTGPAVFPESSSWPQSDALQSATMLLRACARQLDGLAADLEEAGKYSEADRLRTRAKQLRSDARNFSQPQESETPR